MITTKDKSKSDNKVTGFSKRFMTLLKTCGFAVEDGFVEAAQRHGVVYNTFKNWAVKDIPPRSFNALVDVVEAELSAANLQDVYDSDKIALWLLGGDNAVQNPFRASTPSSDDVPPSVVVAILPRLIEASEECGVDYLSLTPEQQEIVLVKAIKCFYAAGLSMESTCRDIKENKEFNLGVQGALTLVSMGLISLSN